jgi:hypothetical protein
VSKATRLPRPAPPGQPQRCADEDERQGTRHLVLLVEPPAGRRHVQVTEPRTKLDGAYAMPWLGDACSPAADVIRVVRDHLHTPKSASLYEACEPAEARRIARKLEWHDPPKHGSWLNMAEIAWSVLQQQCLDRRIPDEATLNHFQRDGVLVLCHAELFC